MENELGTPERAEVKSRRNWWKVAFFVALFAFEVAREWAVLAAAETAKLGVSAMVYGDENYAQAQGSWRRTDGGDRLVPNIVSISCVRDEGRCTETNVHVFEDSVWTPDTSIYQATFSPDTVSYEKGDATCARYFVRIDLKMKEAFQVRERVATTKDRDCARLEPRMEMQLADGYDPEDNPMDDHLVPVFQFLIWLLG